MKRIQLTKQGFVKLQSELNDLIKTKRPQAIERLQKARAMGDLSENSEYIAAKESLALVEERIKEIQTIIQHVEIVENGGQGNKVSLGNKVVVEINGKQEEFEIVGEFEAGPLTKKISNTSPTGKALLGKKIGDKVEVKTPGGNLVYKIINIR